VVQLQELQQVQEALVLHILLQVLLMQAVVEVLEPVVLVVQVAVEQDNEVLLVRQELLTQVEVEGVVRQLVAMAGGLV
jgi:hypothetical protein